MVSTETKIIRRIRRMLLRGPEYCSDEVEKFSYYVSKLCALSLNSSFEKKHFMCCLNRFREQMVADAPLIRFVDVAVQQNHILASALFEELWFTKEDMHMHEGNLAAFFQEEKTIAHQITSKNTGQELAKLKERSTQIKNNIQEDITKLLLKRQTFMMLKNEMRKLGLELSIIMNEQKIVNHLKETMQSLWAAAIDALNLL